ncbi:hypothetical protein MTO96_050879, partial [Rhipicephalus appendiculatus]
HYLLLRTNGNNDHGFSTARIDSPVIKETNKLCTLSFWYNYAFIDDEDSTCSDTDFHCASGACVRKYERCNYIDDCGDNSDEEYCGDYRMSCNFDHSFCDWMPQASPDGTKEGTWRLAGTHRSLLWSPTRDHTTGSREGKFIAFKARSKVENATVIGPTFDNSSYCAVAFIGEHTSSEERGYIAIDDVHFWESCNTTNQELPAAPAPTLPPFKCGGREFQCGALNECIHKSQRCDFKTDCSNGADESRCGFCEFTTDLCGLENRDSSARYGWNWTTVQEGKRNKGFPTTDSRLNEQGAYAAYSLLNPETPKGPVTALVSPKMGEIAHSCVVTFYAYVPEQREASRQATCDFSNFMDCGWFPENLENDANWLLRTGVGRHPAIPWLPTDSESESHR